MNGISTSPQGCRPRTIAFLNQKGGVGKTTSSVNIAAALAEAGRQVCLIDLDPQAHIALHLGIDRQDVTHTVYDLLVDPQVEAIEVVHTARKNLDVIVSEVDLAGAEPELAQVDGRQSILRDKFRQIADCYDLVLIDCPPSLGLLTLNALAMAQEVLVPMQAHFLALQGVGKLLETVGLVCQSVNPNLRVAGIILCMHEGQTTLGKEVVADLDGFFSSEENRGTAWADCQVYRPFIRRNIKLAEAPSFGQTIFDYAPWCKGALDYRRLAQHVLDGRFDDEDPSHSFEPAVQTVEPKREATISSDSVNRQVIPGVTEVASDTVAAHERPMQFANQAPPSPATAPLAPNSTASEQHFGSRPVTTPATRHVTSVSPHQRPEPPSDAAPTTNAHTPIGGASAPILPSPTKADPAIIEVLMRGNAQPSVSDAEPEQTADDSAEHGKPVVNAPVNTGGGATPIERREPTRWGG